MPRAQSYPDNHQDFPGKLLQANINDLAEIELLDLMQHHCKRGITKSCCFQNVTFQCLRNQEKVVRIHGDTPSHLVCRTTVMVRDYLFLCNANNVAKGLLHPS